ncbi:MAG: DUF1569 domain-containing protein [Gemmatimonadota bacterium]|nr:DUF1569 domain-containing protein [Gemmatimonadota bacterium]
MKTLFDPQWRNAIEDRLGALRPDSARLWGRMTPNQAVCHLTDGFRAALGERPIEPMGTVLHRTLIRFVAFTLPLRWMEGAPTAPEFDQERSGTPPVDFSTDVEALRAALGRFVATSGKGLPPHAVFGDFTRGEWGRWGYRHMDHHLRQFGV